MTPYEAVYGVPPPRLLYYTARTTSVQAVEDLLWSRDQILSILKEDLQVAHDRLKHLADRNHTTGSLQLVSGCTFAFNHIANTPLQCGRC